jgi:DNA polymerase III sliding clamp (beta) subunit (PCNA family)
MQLVKASRDALLKPLQVVSGIVERRQTLPILANILVRKDGERVSFTATDLEIQIQTSADIGAGKDAAATTVAARKLVDILRALPEADVALSLSNKKLAIASGKSRFNLQTLAAEEYPTVAQAEFTADFTCRRSPPATIRGSAWGRTSSRRCRCRRRTCAACSVWPSSPWRSRTSATT